jgi:hypothetical protein
MLVFDGKAIAIFRYFVIIILYCKSIHPVIFFNKTRLVICTSRTVGSAKKFVRITSGFGGGEFTKTLASLSRTT